MPPSVSLFESCSVSAHLLSRTNNKRLAGRAIGLSGSHLHLIRASRARLHRRLWEVELCTGHEGCQYDAAWIKYGGNGAIACRYGTVHSSSAVHWQPALASLPTLPQVRPLVLFIRRDGYKITGDRYPALNLVKEVWCLKLLVSQQWGESLPL